MNYSDLHSSRFVVGVLGLSLLSTACIITTSEDDDGVAASSEDGTPTPATGQTSNATGPTTESGDTGTTGGSMEDCTDNLVLDPGFEAGTPSASWEEASMVFDTPICDASCTEEKGADPYAGDWWLWLGGVEDEPEDAFVSQMITIDPDMAFLSFRFQIRSGAGTGDDMFVVELDGDTVFMATDVEMADYGEYTLIELDVSPWADGGTYELRFASQHAGTGLSSFFVDEVSLVSCSEGSATGSGTDTVGQDTTADGGTMSSTGSTGDTGTSTGDTAGSTSGGASSSSGA